MERNGMGCREIVPDTFCLGLDYLLLKYPGMIGR